MPQSTTLLRPSAAEALALSSQPGLRYLEVAESDDEIVISGTLPSYYLKQLAQEAVRPVLGRRRLLNRVRVARAST
jgi:hypothetical protein